MTSGDRADTPPVAVINQSMAQHFWKGEDPIGRRIGVEGREPNEITWLTIVGVSGDVRQYGLANAPTDQVYLGMLQYPGLSTTCLLRTAVEPERMERVVRAAVHAIGPEQPVDRFRTLAEVRSGALETPRLTAVAAAAFRRARRRRSRPRASRGSSGSPFGSAGASSGSAWPWVPASSSVQAMVLGQGMRLVGVGLMLGLGGAFVLTRLWANLLYEVAPTDPPTYVAVALLLGGIAAVACFVPARRATTADPMAALRA